VDARLATIDQTLDFINVNYFLVRLLDFEVTHRIDRRKQFEFRKRLMSKVAEDLESLNLEDLLRALTDIVRVDPAIPFVARFEQLVLEKPEIFKQYIMYSTIKTVRAVMKSKAPRLYMQLLRNTTKNIAGHDFSREGINNLVVLFDFALRAE
jgi:hypothetical protein